MSKINADVDENVAIFFTAVCFAIGIVVGWVFSLKGIEIQEIKPVETGYYITINDEIYYKEVENERN